MVHDELVGRRPLYARVEELLAAGDEPDADRLAGEPVDRRDRALTLLALHDLHLAPIDAVGDAARWQHHPVLAPVRATLERSFLADLGEHAARVDDAVSAVRAIAAGDLVPAVYRWLGDDASWEELVEFLALEGGPDAGFDDLVATCQIGLTGRPKLELARNYWDEMGRGDATAVHTELHRRLVGAIDLPRIPRAHQPVEALERSALGGVLATNRWVQPELVGALGLLELQAGPRCRHVVRAMNRLGASDDARAFYVEHAVADPRHGKGWLDEVVAPLAEDAAWAAGIVRGARWRAEVNRRFFDAMGERFVPAWVEHRLAS